MVTVREATPGEVDVIAATLASAFYEDPLFCWLVPERRREARLRPLFRQTLRSALRRGTVHTSDDGACAALWYPPARWKLPYRELLRAAPVMIGTFSTRVPRAARLISEIESRHPHDEHWYLEVLGSRRDTQRKGVGSAVIGEMLARCDAEGLPAYLEATSPENVPFYLRHGFEVREEATLRGGPPYWPMWREPR